MYTIPITKSHHISPFPGMVLSFASNTYTCNKILCSAIHSNKQTNKTLENTNSIPPSCVIAYISIRRWMLEHGLQTTELNQLSPSPTFPNKTKKEGRGGNISLTPPSINTVSPFTYQFATRNSANEPMSLFEPPTGSSPPTSGGWRVGISNVIWERCCCETCAWPRVSSGAVGMLMGVMNRPVVPLDENEGFKMS